MSDNHINGGGFQVPTQAERLEHAEIDGVHAKKVFPINLPPTAQTNPSTALSYDVNGDLQYIDETIGTDVYRTTLTYNTRVLVGISAAVKL